MAKKFLFIATFKIDPAISFEFQKWMEQIHFPDMHETNCFFGRATKVLDKISDEDFDLVTYIHKVKSITHWEDYKKDFRPELRAKLREKFKQEIKNDQVTVVMCAGLPTEV